MPDTLPPGWTESAPGRLAISRDPVAGGIIDCNAFGWFVIPNSQHIKAMEDLPTRAAAFDALRLAVEATYHLENDAND